MSTVDANRLIFNFFAQHRLPDYVDVNGNLQVTGLRAVTDHEIQPDESFSKFSGICVAMSLAILASVALAAKIFAFVKSSVSLGNPSTHRLLLNSRSLE